MTMPEDSPEDPQDRRLRQLMIAYQAGDLGAFEELYAVLAGEIRRFFARSRRDRAAVNDLVQDLFLEIHRSRRSYAPPLPVRPWIYGIARNVCARDRRKAGRQPMRCAMEADAELQAAPAEGLPASESLDIENALTALPASTREPWLLHHVLGLSFHSIASRLGITVMAAKLRSSRATRAIRRALTKDARPRR
jgi:RNA polymerase sigma-70 factor (ECF subfamily)